MTAFRNGVDWAEAKRNAAIEHAKAIANGVISNDDGDTDEEEDEDNDDEDRDEEDDEDNDDEDELTATAVDPILSSFTSESPFSTGQTSQRSRTARQESDTPADEPDRRRSKCPMREKHSRQKRRDGGKSSSRHGSTSSTSQQVLGWAWKDGAFQYYDGHAPPHSQSAPPTNVWVYYENGWPDGGGKKWRWLYTTGQAHLSMKHSVLYVV